MGKVALLLPASQHRICSKQHVRAVLLIVWIAGVAASIVRGTGNTSTSAASLQTTNQPGTLADLLSLSAPELERLDLARMNLICAEGLRGSENLDVEDLLRTLDGWTHHVERETKRNFHHFVEEPKQFNNSLPYFQMGMMGTVLAEDLRIQYNPERERELLKKPINKQSVEEQSAFFSSSADVFLHGLLSGKHYGTCASMPFLYAAIGRRLGYPVTIAARKYHLYVRYEAGNGEHLNMEATENRGFSTPTDAEYRTGEFPMTQEEIDGCGWLRPLSNKEILGICLLNRANCLRSMKQYDEEIKTLTQAARYLPYTPLMRRVISKNQELATNLHAADRWDELWNELENLRLPTAGLKFEHFQNGKIAAQLFMNQSTNLAEIEKSVSSFKEDLRQYQNEISDSSSKLAEAYGAPKPNAQQQRFLALLKDDLQPVIRIARERVPLEYWEGIPPALEQRLQGINDPEQIVAEINAHYVQDYNRKHGHAPPDETIARQLAGSPAYENLPPHVGNTLVSDPAFGYKKLNPPDDPEARRRWIEEQNAASMREHLQRVSTPNSRIRIVPESALAGERSPAVAPQPKDSENSQLTPTPQSLRTAPTDGKGKP
jgi:hypothetical protein